ncbi:hypothetical protein IV203_011891 [Nitzschia inconspicua]|uniref:Uncharacterized protein n=1 Tax=Nitzschia inconspicua TaxID=303405 RepID=A0A9K3KSN2_9STRA|nr:hypothetical protein IV203_011891 [Nitzschia inconspicua]
MLISWFFRLFSERAGAVYSPLTNLAIVSSKPAMSSSLFFISAAAKFSLIILPRFDLGNSRFLSSSPFVDQQQRGYKSNQLIHLFMADSFFGPFRQWA